MYSSPTRVTNWTRPTAYRQPRLLPAPDGEVARLTLYMVRRMALAGLDDAHAAQAMLGAFGLSYRRPLILLRTTLFELSLAAGRPILLAPCCCRRMTHDEARILAVLRHGPADETRARRHLGRLLNGAEPSRALCAAAAYGWALRDLGRPI